MTGLLLPFLLPLPVLDTRDDGAVDASDGGTEIGSYSASEVMIVVDLDDEGGRDGGEGRGREGGGLELGSNLSWWIDILRLRLTSSFTLFSLSPADLTIKSSCMDALLLLSKEFLLTSLLRPMSMLPRLMLLLLLLTNVRLLVLKLRILDDGDDDDG